MSSPRLVQYAIDAFGASASSQGSYTIYMKMVGDDDEELSCISFGFSIGFVASS
jgi:hypothetical protein